MDIALLALFLSNIVVSMIPSEIRCHIEEIYQCKKAANGIFCIFPFSLVFDGIQQILVMYK